MGHINNYGVELTDSEIQKGMHREPVGGMWEEIGRLQFDFLIQNGLKPDHKLLDVGCVAVFISLNTLRKGIIMALMSIHHS